MYILEPNVTLPLFLILIAHGETRTTTKSFFPHTTQQPMIVLDMAGSKSAFAEVTDLPSICGNKKKNKKNLLGKRDKRATKAAGLNSWDGNKVRTFIMCYKCDKR